MTATDTQSNKKESESKMIQRTVRLPDTLWTRAIDKANGLMSVSAVIRRLLEMWINDEIDIHRKK
jgi:hypothetical protein